MKSSVVTLKNKLGNEEETSGEAIPSRDLNCMPLECKSEAMDNSKNYTNGGVLGRIH
jgi:hypothetical protein